MHLINPATRRRLESLHPEVATEIANLERVLDDSSLDPNLLTLVGDYFDTALREESWTPPDSLGELEADCLAVCEQFMVSVSDLNESQMAALARHLGPDDLYNLMYAIYLIEMSKRLDLTLERTLQ